MVDDFRAKFNELRELVKSHSKYIKANNTKKRVADFYTENWLPFAKDFKKKYGKAKHDLIENNLAQMYEHSKKAHIEKKKILDLFKTVEPVIDNLRIELIRKHGSPLEQDKKQQTIKKLSASNFSGTISYLKDAEKDHTNGNWKGCCSNARLAAEEFLREFREKRLGKQVKNGTFQDHVSALKPDIDIKLGEKLFLDGLYNFLSNKGSHATGDKPTQEDSSLAISLNYVLIDYLLEKFGKMLKEQD